MSEQPQPNIARSLYAFHAIITRALDVSIEAAQTYAEEEFPDDATQEGFLTYTRTLVSLLESHHETEDELAFPYFRDKLPDAPFDLLMAQHEEMLPIMEDVQVALKEAGESPNPQRLEKLAEELQDVRALWQPHINIEERHFDPQQLAELLPVEEHVRLGQEYAEHTGENAGPPPLTIPFMLYNLPEDKRALMAAEMPDEVVNHLVPNVWREQWAVMSPLLLR